MNVLIPSWQEYKLVQSSRKQSHYLSKLYMCFYYGPIASGRNPPYRNTEQACRNPGTSRQGRWLKHCRIRAHMRTTAVPVSKPPHNDSQPQLKLLDLRPSNFRMAWKRNAFSRERLNFGLGSLPGLVMCSVLFPVKLGSCSSSQPGRSRGGATDAPASRVAT